MKTISENRHPIAVVAARTGLSVDVLRIWERRYQAVVPERSASGERSYSDEDVRRLRLLKQVTEAGRSIGRVAQLATSELAALAEADATSRQQVRRTPAVQQHDELVDVVVEEVLARTRALDAGGVYAALQRASVRYELLEFLETVLVPVLRRVGDEWHAGNLSVAQEHLTSSVVEHRIMEAMHMLAREDAEPTVVVATLQGERHAIGAALAAATAAAAGARVVYLGADLPAEDIAVTAIAAKAKLVAISSIYVEDRKKLLEEFRELRARLADDVVVLAGGAGANANARELGRMAVNVGSDLSELRVALATNNLVENRS